MEQNSNVKVLKESKVIQGASTAGAVSDPQNQPRDSLHSLNWDAWKEEMTLRVTSHIQQKVGEYYPDLRGETDIHAVLERPPSQRRYTVIFEIALESSAGKGLLQRMIAKVYRVTPKKGAQDQDIDQKSFCEYQFHREVYDYFAKQPGTYSVVRPVDYTPELRCLIIERAVGIDLGKLIRQIRYSLSGYSLQRQELGKHFQHCGKWLWLLHQGFAAADVTTFVPAAIGRQVNAYYHSLIHAGGSAEIANPIRHRILEMSQFFAGEQTTCGRLHGDFKLRHIFVSGDQISPIDFGNELKGVTYDDVARLLVELKLLNYGLRLPVRQELMTYLQNQFLLGYFGTPQWPPLLRCYYVVWLLGKWSRRLKKLSTNPFVKKIDKIIEPIGMKKAVNCTYVDNWFRRELYAELEQLQRELR